jgi:hypothetical protein
MQTGARLHDDTDSDRRRHAARLLGRLHQLIEWDAVDPLHRQEQHAILLAQVEDLDGVRMAHLRRERRLVEKHLLELLVFAELRQHRLDGDDLLEASRALEARGPYHCHAAGRDGHEQLITTEHVTGTDLVLAHGGRGEGSLFHASLECYSLDRTAQSLGA